MIWVCGCICNHADSHLTPDYSLRLPECQLSPKINEIKSCQRVAEGQGVCRLRRRHVGLRSDSLEVTTKMSTGQRRSAVVTLLECEVIIGERGDISAHEGCHQVGMLLQRVGARKDNAILPLNEVTDVDD